MTDANLSNRPAETAPPPSSGSPVVPTVQSAELMRGGRELRIVHGQQVYRLVLTRNNKLILQK